MSQLLIVEQTDAGYAVVHIEGKDVNAVRRLTLDAQHVLNSLDRIAEGDCPTSDRPAADRTWPDGPCVVGSVIDVNSITAVGDDCED